MEKQKNIFQKIGGAYQYQTLSPQQLVSIPQLDPALWAALSAPVATLNCDAAFLACLDADNNGEIRVDEVKKAVNFVQTYFADLADLTRKELALELKSLNLSNPDGRQLLEFVQKAKLPIVNGKLSLAAIQTELAKATSCPLQGDGIVTMAAVAKSAQGLFKLAVEFSGGTVNLRNQTGLTTAQLSDFLAQSAAFLSWSDEGKVPLFGTRHPVKFYPVYTKLKAKIDEFFRYCDLVKLAPENAARFTDNPAALPALDLHDAAAVQKFLADAPLGRVNAESKLPLLEQVNPFYADSLTEFAQTFELSTLTCAQWAQFKADFAPYENYLRQAPGRTIGHYGQKVLSDAVAAKNVDVLQKCFADDQAIKQVVQQLKNLQQMILYQVYLLDFINNFVSFRQLFVPHGHSLLQAGRLVMDGRTFELCMWVTEVAAHKKIAVGSGLCMLYLALHNRQAEPLRYVAVAVTAGDLERIYLDKPVFFIAQNEVCYSGKIIDVVEGAISFNQSVWAPFRKIGNLFANKLRKLTENTTMEQKLNQKINAIGTPAPTAGAPAAKPALGTNSLLFLAGGVGIAAIGAALSLVAKTLLGIAESIAEMSLWKIAGCILVVFLIFYIPAALNAYFKLRRRSLSLFLESGGWAVNLPIRLSAAISQLFTHYGRYPDPAVFDRNDLALSGQYRTYQKVLDVLLSLCGLYLTAMLIYWYINRF